MNPELIGKLQIENLYKKYKNKIGETVVYSGKNKESRLAIINTVYPFHMMLSYKTFSKGKLTGQQKFSVSFNSLLCNDEVIIFCNDKELLENVQRFS